MAGFLDDDTVNISEQNAYKAVGPPRTHYTPFKVPLLTLTFEVATSPLLLHGHMVIPHFIFQNVY